MSTRRTDDFLVTLTWPNKITGPNAGGPRQLTIRTSLTARVGQFWRYPESTT